jgi:predicted metal-binding membrane protein
VKAVATPTAQAGLTRSERWVLPALLALIATAWAALWLLDGTSHAHHLPSHAPISLTLRASLFVGGWLLMTIAMMLPSALPLVDLFRRLTRTRGDAPTLILLLIAGYLLAYSAYGMVVFAAIELTAPTMGALASGAHPALLPGCLLLIAGAFQFSALKHRCLTECRTPLGFILRRWNGAQPHWRSLRLGFDHGMFCVGCCWALMLLMFAVNVASLAWMLLLGAVMAAEKNFRFGNKLTAPLGVLLLGAGAVLLVAGNV